MIHRQILCRTLMLMLIAAAMCVIGAGVVVTEDINVTFEGHFGDILNAVDVSENYAHTNQGFDFVVLDIANNNTSVEMRMTDIGNLIEDIAVAEKYIYVADSANLASDTPPTISIVHPTPDTITVITVTNTTLIASTNEPAIVKYDFVDVNYTQMNYTFSNTGAFTHTTPLTNLPAGNNTVYATASDVSGNINTTTVNVSWSVMPTLFLGGDGGDVSGDGMVDAWDITYLARAIAGIIGYELSPALPSMELCASCHVTTAQILSNSNTKHSNLVCAYCHPTHGQIPTCVSCHATPHGPALINCGISCHLSAHDVWKVRG